MTRKLRHRCPPRRILRTQQNTGSWMLAQTDSRFVCKPTNRCWLLATINLQIQIDADYLLPQTFWGERFNDYKTSDIFHLKTFDLGPCLSFLLQLTFADLDTVHIIWKHDTDVTLVTPEAAYLPRHSAACSWCPDPPDSSQNNIGSWFWNQQTPDRGVVHKRRNPVTKLLYTIICKWYILSIATMGLL